MWTHGMSDNRSNKCTAITQRPSDAPCPCEQEAIAGNPMKVCSYHYKMYLGDIAPFFEDANVKTRAGTVIYSPGSVTKKRRAQHESHC